MGLSDEIAEPLSGDARRLPADRFEGEEVTPLVKRLGIDLVKEPIDVEAPERQRDP